MAGEIRVCLVFDDRLRKLYHHREVQSLIESGYEVPLVLIDETSSPSMSQKLALMSQFELVAKSLLRGEFRILVNIERKLADIIKPESTVTEEMLEQSNRVDIFQSVSELNEAETVYFEPKKVGNITYDFPVGVIERITDTCDVVVLVGFSRILTGDILSQPSLGVLSFHGADIRRYRGRPGAFFQWINGESEIGMTLQRLTNDLDGGELILCEHTDISNAQSWHEVRYRAVKLFDDMLVRGLEKLEDPQFDPEVPELGRLTYAREGHELINVLRCLLRNIKIRYFK